MSYIRKVRFLARTFILSASYRRFFFTRFRLAVFFYLNERDYSNTLSVKASIIFMVMIASSMVQGLGPLPLK